MTIDTGWLVLGALALLAAWLGATILRGGRRGRARPPAAAAPDASPVGVSATTLRSDRVTTAPALRSPPVVAAGAMRAEPVPRVAARAAAPPQSTAPVAPATATAPATVAAATARMQATTRYERVLGVELASDSAWHAALPLALQAGQAQAVAALCAPAFDAARREPVASGPVLALTFPASSILRIACGDASLLRATAADNDGSTLRALAWLDSSAASALATTFLAALTAERHLDPLGVEANELRAAAAGVCGGASAGSVAERLQAAVQALWRLHREVRANPAAALVKPASRQQADQAVDAAVALWRELHAGLDAARRELVPMQGASMADVGQLDRTLLAVREASELRRLQQLAAPTLAAAHVLRLALGGVPMPAGVHSLQSASAALRTGALDDAALVAQLRPVARDADDEPGAEGGRGLAARRAALAALLDTLAGTAVSREAVDVLASAYAVCAEGFPDASGGDNRWLVRGHAGPERVEVRRAPVVRLH